MTERCGEVRRLLQVFLMWTFVHGAFVVHGDLHVENHFQVFPQACNESALAFATNQVVSVVYKNCSQVVVVDQYDMRSKNLGSFEVLDLSPYMEGSQSHSFRMFRGQPDTFFVLFKSTNASQPVVSDIRVFYCSLTSMDCTEPVHYQLPTDSLVKFEGAPNGLGIYWFGVNLDASPSNTKALFGYAIFQGSMSLLSSQRSWTSVLPGEWDRLVEVNVLLMKDNTSMLFALTVFNSSWQSDSIQPCTMLSNLANYQSNQSNPSFTLINTAALVSAFSFNQSTMAIVPLQHARAGGFYFLAKPVNSTQETFFGSASDESLRSVVVYGDLRNVSGYKVRVSTDSDVDTVLFYNEQEKDHVLLCNSVGSIIDYENVALVQHTSYPKVRVDYSDRSGGPFLDMSFQLGNFSGSVSAHSAFTPPRQTGSYYVNDIRYSMDAINQSALVVLSNEDASSVKVFLLSESPAPEEQSQEVVPSERDNSGARLLSGSLAVILVLLLITIL